MNIESRFVKGKPLALFVGEEDRSVMHRTLYILANEPSISTLELRIKSRHMQLGDPGGHVGLGLGLSIARRLVKLHGGTIAAHSDGAGFGACFVIRLPLATH